VTIEIRGMPWPVRLFLAYALVILAGIGLSLRFVVDQAIAAPVSPLGIVVMVLLAYTIFTTTLVLQRKAASRALALGLASLTVPPIPWALVLGLVPVAIFFLALSILLIRGLRSQAVAKWLSEE
jgi:predicted lysophospholipase L1 biosynthesis ABC-type transport system permease subunit